MTEELRRFGTDARLCGVLSLPQVTIPSPGGNVAVVFITAGLLHKPGPHRLYVELSRSLAAMGLPVLRFDLSGIGESSPCSSGESAEQAVVTDVREAMDAVEDELGIHSFVLAGLCSGAEVAHRTAVVDERVSGVIAMDGYIPRTRAFYIWHYLPRLFSLRKWLDFTRAALHRLSGRGTRPTESAEDQALQFWNGPGPDRDQLAREFDTLCRRGVRQLQLISGGSGACSYARQFQDAFHDVDFRQLLDVRFFADADHMYVLHADRRQLIRTVVHWTSVNFVPETGQAVMPQEAVPVQHGHWVGQPDFVPQASNSSRQSARLAERRNFE